MNVKVIARQTSDIFLRHSIVLGEDRVMIWWTAVGRRRRWSKWIGVNFKGWGAMGHVPPIILLRVMTPITGRLGTFSVCQKMSKIKFVPHALIQAQNAPKPVFDPGSGPNRKWSWEFTTHPRPCSQL